MPRSAAYRWEFKPRFRRGAFGWRSQPAMQRLKQALSEIKKVGRKDPALAAEGAVLLLERLSPALENVDSSSGAIGSAVNATIGELVKLIAGAPLSNEGRSALLERLWLAHEADQIPYIERLGDHWGEVCVSKELASSWADRTLERARLAWSPDPDARGTFHGTTACLSALFHAGRLEELLALLELDRTRFLPYRRWGVRALLALGRKAEAIRYAEACRSRWESDPRVDELCEEILLSSGLVEEAYRRYALTATRRSTYLATYRALAEKYPQKKPAELLADLAATTPGEEGKWFAAAKDAGLFDEALALALQSPTDPRTLTRAARAHAVDRPRFALEAALAALSWLAKGYGYEVTSADVWEAFGSAVVAARNAGCAEAAQARVRELVQGAAGGFVAEVLSREPSLR